MKAFFDTSVLVPVFYGDHEHHAASLSTFLAYPKADGCCGVHSLAETFATITRMPGKYRVSGEQALLFIDDIVERLTIISLTGHEYTAAVRRWANAGVQGGRIYDALLASCALKSEASRLYTWNTKHYEGLTPDLDRRLRTPAQPK